MKVILNIFVKPKEIFCRLSDIQIMFYPCSEKYREFTSIENNEASLYILIRIDFK
jgi:hypothetical protein